MNLYHLSSFIFRSRPCSNLLGRSAAATATTTARNVVPAAAAAATTPRTVVSPAATTTLGCEFFMKKKRNSSFFPRSGFTTAFPKLCRLISFVSGIKKSSFFFSIKTRYLLFCCWWSVPFHVREGQSGKGVDHSEWQVWHQDFEVGFILVLVFHTLFFPRLAHLFLSFAEFVVNMEFQGSVIFPSQILFGFGKSVLASLQGWMKTKNSYRLFCLLFRNLGDLSR